LVVLVTGFGFMQADYFLHPEAREFQRRVETEVRSVPLPPLSSEAGFNSGYQPDKGFASRSIATSLSGKDLCFFYALALGQSGWVIEHRYDDQTADGRSLIAFRKGTVTLALVPLPEMPSGRRFGLVANWKRGDSEK
jgi:hypothetical protein